MRKTWVGHAMRPGAGTDNLLSSVCSFRSLAVVFSFLIHRGKFLVLLISSLLPKSRRGRRPVNDRQCNLHLEFLIWSLLPLWHKEQWQKPWLPLLFWTASCLFLLGTHRGTFWQKDVWWESLPCDCCSDTVQTVETLYSQRKFINYVVFWFPLWKTVFQILW